MSGAASSVTNLFTPTTGRSPDSTSWWILYASSAISPCR